MFEEFKQPQASIAKPTPIDREVSWDKSKTLISETDRFGTITNVNEAFCAVSGYASTELIGQPHNVIRHPDMPKIVFKMLWDNIKQGNNFAGVVKNLSKNGEYYWVITDFEMRKDAMGNITHYLGRRKSVPEKVITNYVAPLYETLLKLEKVGGMDLSSRFFKNYLAMQKKDYIDFVISIMAESEEEMTFKADASMSASSEVVSDDIYHVNEAMNEKRKNFFDRLFS